MSIEQLVKKPLFFSLPFFDECLEHIDNEIIEEILSLSDTQWCSLLLHYKRGNDLVIHK